MKILVTGGAGYIGSHFVLELLKEPSNQVTVVDNFSLAKANIIENERVVYKKIDLLDKAVLQKVFSEDQFEVVAHFAALADVPDSVRRPLEYYNNNIVGGLNLLECMVKNGVTNMIFSSSAAVYGNPVTEKISENHPKSPINPYGFTKLAFENILADFNKAYGLSSVSFRYFCAAGCDNSLRIGENHVPENHVIPNIVLTLLGKREEFNVYGDDYETPDGSAIRDYIHVTDLADAHVKALDLFKKRSFPFCEAFNLGTNRGYSVLELAAAAEKISGKKLKKATKPRRPGDPVSLVADASRAKEIIGWSARFGLEDIFSSAYGYIKNNI